MSQTVVHVMGPASLAGTAQFRTVKSLRAHLTNDRYQLKAWFIGDDGPYVDELTAVGVPSKRIPFSGMLDPAGIRRLARVLAAERPAIVHLHVGGRALTKLAHAFGACVIAHLSASHGEDLKPLPLDSFAQRADAVIACSHFLASQTATDAVVIYPGIDPTIETGVGREGPPWLIGSAGRLAPIKGFEHLVTAIGLLRDRGFDARAEIAGAGPAERDLRDLVQKLGLGSEVTLLGWRDEFVDCYRRWHAFAVPSLHEGFGIAALDAMSGGLPVVASAVGGLPELVRDGATGHLVPPGRADELADALVRLLQDPARSRMLRTAARERAATCFSAEVAAQLTTNVYDAVLVAR